jgi:hypothetical protein
MIEELQSISESLKKVAANIDIAKHKSKTNTNVRQVIYTKLASDKVLDFLKFFGVEK